MNWGRILSEGTLGAVTLMAQVFAVVMPLMLILALLEWGRVFERAARHIGGRLGRVGLSERAVLPLLVGALWGVTYGAGALIQAGREKLLNPRELAILGLFLGLSHALVEDTALFAIPGASLWWLIPGRLAITFVVVALCWRWVVAPEQKQNAPGALPDSQRE